VFVRRPARGQRSCVTGSLMKLGACDGVQLVVIAYQSGIVAL
jgi:hypothetical protein